jgi:hypothetical protein
MKLIIPTRDDDARVVVVPPELLPGGGAVLVALALGADGVRGWGDGDVRILAFSARGGGRPDLGRLSSGVRETTRSNAKRRRRSEWNQGGAAMALRRRGARRRPSPPSRSPGRLCFLRALPSPVTGYWLDPFGILRSDPRALKRASTWPNPFMGQSNPTRPSCIGSP